MGPLLSLLGKMTTLLARLTATRAGYLDYINTLHTIWTAARGATLDTAKTNTDTLIARLTSARATRLDHLDADISSVGGSPAVQSGSATIGTSSSSVTVAITAVTLSKAVLQFSYYVSLAGTLTLQDANVSGHFQDATHIIFSRGGSAGSVTIKWFVVAWPS